MGMYSTLASAYDFVLDTHFGMAYHQASVLKVHWAGVSLVGAGERDRHTDRCTVGWKMIWPARLNLYSVDVFGLSHGGYPVLLIGDGK